MRTGVSICLALLVAAVGCSKKDSDSSDNKAVAPSDQPVATTGSGSGTRPERPNRTARLAAIRDQLDTNHDGKLSPDELSKATQPFLHFDDTAAVDADHDGDITVDELAAALRARRGAFHRDRMFGAGSAGAAGSAGSAAAGSDSAARSGNGSGSGGR